MLKPGGNLVLRDLFSLDVIADTIEWQPFKEGVDIHPLYGSSESGPSAALLRYERGARVPMHVHQGYEHIVIVAGSQTDGSDVYERGTLLISAPGSRHHVASDDGCVVLAIWQAPVSFQLG